ncbi:MAG: flavodoxin domain-containing protein [Clostridiaceae bacterium]|nr:flavodoxin domain-containing protein [Clostridiaceae bacterium]
MVIVYESKTGFTKRYAEMLAAKTGLKVYHVKEISKINQDEGIIFLGWTKVGKIQGLNKVRRYNVKAICGSGTGRTAEPDVKAVIARNNIEGIPFFYLRGGCLPLKKIKGMDRIMLSMFVKILKSRKEKDERTEESIDIILNGFDGVKEENLEPLLEWLKNQPTFR